MKMTQALLVAKWNDLKDFPRVRIVNSSRKRKIDRLLKEFPMEFWPEVFEKLQCSSFCKGDNNRGWVANFDWFIRPETATKIIEGFYDDRIQKVDTYATRREQGNLTLMKRAQSGEFDQYE